MTIVFAALLVIGVLAFTLFIRPKDVPEPLPVSPLQHLEDRKSAIYDNLRDLQFEYRLGKLSESDYQRTKTSLQKELAGVLAEMEETARKLGLATRRTAPRSKAQAQIQMQDLKGQNTCPHCGAKFSRAMRFCGECGKAMTA
jgi:hypothetical protein